MHSDSYGRVKNYVDVGLVLDKMERKIKLVNFGIEKEKQLKQILRKK